MGRAHTVGGALLVVSSEVFVILAVLARLTLLAIRKAASAMSETKSEFAENLLWLKATLISPKTSPRNQLRRDLFKDCQFEPSRTSEYVRSS